MPTPKKYKNINTQPEQKLRDLTPILFKSINKVNEAVEVLENVQETAKLAVLATFNKAVETNPDIEFDMSHLLTIMEATQETFGAKTHLAN